MEEVSTISPPLPPFGIQCSVAARDAEIVGKMQPSRLNPQIQNPLSKSSVFKL